MRIQSHLQEMWIGSEKICIFWANHSRRALASARTRTRAWAIQADSLPIFRPVQWMSSPNTKLQSRFEHDRTIHQLPPNHSIQACLPGVEGAQLHPRNIRAESHLETTGENAERTQTATRPESLKARDLQLSHTRHPASKQQLYAGGKCAEIASRVRAACHAHPGIQPSRASPAGLTHALTRPHP